MIWKDVVQRLAAISSRKGVAAAIVYGLSLTVRFTSAAGDEADIRRTDPAMSVVTGDGPRLAYQDWGRKPAPSIVSRQGWSQSSQSPGCPLH
ncbi:hypothetical protein [Bradyrhizobium sp. CB1015]|uniref:hypothetical protein n=1 Tax=Bradyrhizobium sp. CB1015 TaxID=2976822 RepID=UPI0021AA91F1|nr:hypothetical protein [Bradyrhizobium sp. CB1015]UWU90837.1 hypothetical protein N2604_30940 [Bradyrhizobium sp. CB1015]